MRAPKSCSRAQANRSTPAWHRLLDAHFPELAAMMPDPSRLRLFPVSNRSVLQAWHCASARVSGGRTDGR